MGGEIFCTRPAQPWFPTLPPIQWYRVFPGVKRPVCGVDHLLPYSVEVKEEEVELYLLHVCIFMTRSRVSFAFYIAVCVNVIIVIMNYPLLRDFWACIGH